MIKIEYIYSTNVTINYYDGEDATTFYSTDCGQLGDIVECVTEKLVKHNLHSANILSAETGEILVTITRN